ncbi:MAG: ABC-2 type transport system permease protein [Halieaceae bacterium]
MFKHIALFELRYQLRNPVFWVVAGIFFLLTFGAMTIDNIRIGSGGNVHANSPQAIIQTMAIMTLFFMFVTTAFVANVVVRDDESGFGPMVRSTRVSKRDYLFGRFSGAFTAAALAFLAVPLGILLGALMPWLDSETLGPTVAGHYLYAYAVMALPGVLLTASLFFAVACATRSMLHSYMAVVLFMVLYFAFTGIAGSKPELRDLVAIVEPFGLGAFGDATRYWSAAQANTEVPALAGNLLLNRLLVIAASVIALLVAYWRYSFAEKGLSERALKKQQKTTAKLARAKPLIVDSLPDPRPEAAWASRLLARARFEMALIFKSPSFFVLLIIGLTNATAALLFANEIYGTPARPLTFALLDPLAGTFAITPIIVAIFYAGELVWRDRERNMHEIIDATSLPNWAYLAPKVLAVAAVLISTLAISVLAAVLVQLARGHTALELDKYLLWYLLPFAVDMLLLAMLAVLLQAISSGKYVGWGLMVLFLVATITLNEMGFEHPLYLYGEAGANPVSDLNGADVGLARSWWLRLYWTGIAIIMAVIAHLLWRRGTALSLRSRLSRIPAQLRRTPGAVALLGLTIAVSSGSWIFYQMNVLNQYVVSDAREQRLADFEKAFLQYEDVPQPSLTSVTLNIDLYPEQKRAKFAGRYELLNDTGAPVEELHIRFAQDWSRLDKLSIPGTTLKLDELDRYGYRIYQLNEPLLPGETSWLEFESERNAQGFRASGEDDRLVRNGTFLNNTEFAPLLGFDRSTLLQDRQTRRKYDLPAELRMPALEDDSAREKNYVGNADWVSSDITISTSAWQVPVAPGDRITDTTVGNRRTARFVSETPILALFSIQSAEYAVRSRSVEGVELEVYFHPAHDFNVERMLDALAQSLDYYRRHFGPYQFDYARIIEFPGYARFAQAFAGTIPYSEDIGFIADIAEGDAIDYVTFVTAHEAAHQYWAHQLISAYMQGGTMLVEAIAEYSALMVMKEINGEDSIRRFLKYDLDRYLSARGSEAIEELPLVRVENQGYIHYRKGGHVLYLLQERLGETRVNSMLAALLDRYRFKSQPYASSKDLLEGFQSLARNEQEARLIEDSLEKITLYDLSAESAVVTELDDGRFETLLSINATKSYADGIGEESESTLDQLVQVGLFTARPGFGALDPEDVLLREWRDLRSGEQQLRMVSERRPAFAGIDPYTMFIDRNSDDNIVAVGDAP